MPCSLLLSNISKEKMALTKCALHHIDSKLKIMYFNFEHRKRRISENARFIIIFSLSLLKYSSQLTLHKNTIGNNMAIHPEGHWPGL